ncbi:hypothetical protein CIT31_31115 [Mesorhizobium wenxiniae]|uniref:Uncharacterized protein n=1 Tax=Mesorhizobium wenxiniae TaxID=2014805 RepID=A0A271K7G6_9HYPH|nr:hypothetical protein CIT31_31115 [Mesorhizobium wenxiniae]
MILVFGTGFFLHRAADHAALAMVRLKNGGAGKDRSQATWLRAGSCRLRPRQTCRGAEETRRESRR